MFIHFTGTLQPTKKTKKSTSKKTSKSPKKKSSKKGKDKKKQPPPDLFSPAAMSNAYYISHDAVDFLTFRGYRWEGATTKKKKKK